MLGTAYRLAAACAAVSVNLVLISCSQTSTAPKMGTPAYSWSAAQDTYKTGDYVKTIEHLDKILATDNELTAKAQPWQLILTSGMSRGYKDAADAYEAGAKMNRLKLTDFRRQTTIARKEAGRLAMHFAEVFDKFQNNKSEYVTLEFSYPSGIPTPVVALTKIANGQLLPTPDLESAQKRALERGVLIAACNAVGAPDDPAKAQDLMKNRDAKVARATFVMAMATTLHDSAQLFSRSRLDDPDKLKIFCTRAQAALKTVPETKQTKDLNSKIEKTLKGLKAT